MILFASDVREDESLWKIKFNKVIILSKHRSHSSAIFVLKKKQGIKCHNFKEKYCRKIGCSCKCGMTHEKHFKAEWITSLL